MAPLVLENCKIYLGGYDFSGEANQLALEYTAELLGDTAFNTGRTRSNLAGLLAVTFGGTVFTNPETPAAPDVSYDQYLFQRIGATREVLSVAPVGDAVGDVTYLTRKVTGSYVPISGGQVGALMAAELSGAAANTKLCRGVVLALGTKIATGVGAAVNLGAAAEGKHLYSSIHVMDPHGTAGETLDVIIESDAAELFDSPTTRLTHTQFTVTRGAGWQEYLVPVGGGGITDTWWRASWTIAGAAASYKVFVTLAIM